MLKSFGTLPIPYEFKKPLMFGASPNISGYFSVDRCGFYAEDTSGSYSAPFYLRASGFTGVTQELGTKAVSVNMDLSRSSSLFKGSKFQPSALQMLACIRI